MDRKHSLQTPNFLMYARDRPQMPHRLCFWVGCFGVFFAFTTIANRATNAPWFGLICFLNCVAFDERHAESFQQFHCLKVGLRSCHERDIHAVDLCNFIGVDLAENNLFLDAEGIVAAPVERFVGNTAKIADLRHGNAHEPVKKLIHLSSAQRYAGSDRNALAKLKIRNSFFRLGDRRFLTGDLLQLFCRRLEQFRILCGGSDSHVERDLFQPRHLHDAFIVEALHHGRREVLFVHF